MSEYQRITITLPDGSQVFRMAPKGLGAEASYSRAQSGKSWAKDHKPAESAGVTRPTRPDNPSRIDTSVRPEELPEDPGIEVPPSLALKRFVETVAHGAWEVFKNLTGISTWEETLEIVDDPELTPEQKRQRMQEMTQYSIFDLVSVVHIPGMSELTNLAVNPVRKAIKDVGEQLLGYMGKVGRYLGELTGLQAEVLSQAEKRALANAARLNKTIPAEITDPLERAARVVEKLDLELYVQEGQSEYLKALASRTEEPPNAYMAVVGSREFSDEAAVHSIVKRLVDNGYGIASGGATGADHHALTAITNLNPKAGKIYTVGDLDPQVVNPGEVEPLLELLRQGGDLRIGQIHAPAGYEEYSKALLKRSDDMVRDPTVGGVVAFLEPGADNGGTWHTVGRAIAEDKRTIVYSADPDLLQADFVKAGHWSPLENNPNFHQWVTTGDRIAFVDEVTGEVEELVAPSLDGFAYRVARQAIEKKGNTPALIARDNGQAIAFPKTGAQLQDWELLSRTGSSSCVLTQEGKAYRFVPEGEDPSRFTVQEVSGSQAVQLIVDGVVDTESSFPQAIRKIYRKKSKWGDEPPPDWSVKDYTVEAKSLQEAIEKANPDERPQFANDLDRMIWEGFMSSRATLAYREDIATEKGYRQLLHISSQTGASFDQANELRKAWDTIGDTPDLYRFHYEEVKRFKKEAKAAGQAEEEGLTKAIDQYRNLAGELEKVTRVKDTDVMGALQRSYERDDLLGFDRTIDEYERVADVLDEGIDEGSHFSLEPDEIFTGGGAPTAEMYTDEGKVRTWIPLGELEELSFSRPSWISQQPRQYQDLISSIEEAADADLPGIGQEIQRRALGGELTRNQKAVAFETYFRAKARILEKAEKHMKSDAQKTRKAILKAKTPQELARLGERMYKGQKEGRGDISPREWTILWKEYNQRKEELAPGLPRGKKARRAQGAGAMVQLSITIRRAG